MVEARASFVRSALGLVAAAAMLAACCGNSDRHVLEDGDYIPADDEFMGTLQPYASSPPAITIDRANGVVLVRYQEGGQAVVERWRVVSTEMDAR